MIEHHHFVDRDGNPAGGATFGPGFCIAWQNGPLGRGSQHQRPNGAFVEDVIKAAVRRLEFYQQGPFACDENASAIGFLYAAIDRLMQRTAEREARGVEGTMEP